MLDDDLNKKWVDIRKIRRTINGALELARQDKIIGSSLDAEIKLYVKDNEYIPLIESIDINEIAIVSKYEIIEGSNIQAAYKEDSLKGLEIVVSKAKGDKCVRCWKIFDNFAYSSEDPLCERCTNVVK